MRQIMERKKKTVFRRLSAALLVLILCAGSSCGHGEDTARDPAAEQETVETAATAEDAYRAHFRNRGSPYRWDTVTAEDLAALVAEGRGVLMPNLDEPHVEYRGVQVLPGDFLLGLIPVMEHGVTVYPKPNALAPERADGKMAGIKQKRGV